MQTISGKTVAGAEYELYLSDMNIIDSMNLVKYNDTTSINMRMFNSINTLNTSDEQLCREAERWINQVILRSELLNSSTERIRDAFFNALETQILDALEMV
jgi:hypothetical protein